MGEHLAVRTRIHREDMVVVGDLQGAAHQPQLQLAAFQRGAVPVAQHRDEDLVRQFLLDRMPLDVEEARPLRGGSVLQQVQPEGVSRAHAHVVGDDVHHVPQPARLGRSSQLGHVLRRAQLGVELLVVLHVVAVHRPRRGPEHGRGVQVADAQLGEVGLHFRRGAEAEPFVQLQPVGRERLGDGRQLARHLVEQAAGPLLRRGGRPQIPFLAQSPAPREAYRNLPYRSARCVSRRAAATTCGAVSSSPRRQGKRQVQL